MDSLVSCRDSEIKAACCRIDIRWLSFLGKNLQGKCVPAVSENPTNYTLPGILNPGPFDMKHRFLNGQGGCPKGSLLSGSKAKAFLLSSVSISPSPRCSFLVWLVSVACMLPTILLQYQSPWSLPYNHHRITGHYHMVLIFILCSVRQHIVVQDLYLITLSVLTTHPWPWNIIVRLFDILKTVVIDIDENLLMKQSLTMSMRQVLTVT